jgi:HNH endonuclease
VSAYVPIDLRRQIRDRFSECCAYCATPERLTVATFEVEHVTPRSAGGATSLDNLCLACPTCNRCKANRLLASDPLTMEQVGLFHPCRHVWSEHFAWNSDRIEIMGVSAIGRATIVALRMNRPQLIRLRQMWTALGEF